MKGQCFILQNVMDNSWQTFNFNTVQVQICCCWNGAAIVQFCFLEGKGCRNPHQMPHIPQQRVCSACSV